MVEHDAPSKSALRARLLATRAARSPEQEGAAEAHLAERVLALPQMTDASTVAAYVSIRGEPGTSAILAALLRRGTRLLLPRLCADLDLDWAELTDAGLRPGRFGIPEPPGPLLGRDAVADAQVVLCPGLAGDQSGHRLGRGGGSFDRALARLGPSAFRVLLLYDDEVLDAVPHEQHDQQVDAIVTPARTVSTRASA